MVLPLEILLVSLLRLLAVRREGYPACILQRFPQRRLRDQDPS